MAITSFACMLIAVSQPASVVADPAASLPPPVVMVAPARDVAPLAEMPLTLDVAEVSAPRKKRHLTGRYVDILAHAGIVMPNGTLFDNAQVGPLVGGGISREMVLAYHSAVRASLAYNYARLSAKQADREGHLSVHAVWLRADYLYGQWRARPFVGIGIGFYPWRGAITNKATGDTNSQKTIDLGATAAVGADIRICSCLSVAPEISYTRIAGNFSDNLWGAQIAARWSL